MIGWINLKGKERKKKGERIKEGLGWELTRK
jgi:hypothetical protein